ncbi:MAG TPA: T9SS type A sorting domain-containing protein, partial [Ignavibacteriaceae bacterium]|nr:T9SS type A sorting domain-containing protein [Ignavibacteriaceae bacterium]
GIFFSTNNGISWNVINNGLTNLYVMSLLKKDNYLFASTYEGVFRSTDNGNSWQKATPIFPFPFNEKKISYVLYYNNETIFTGTEMGVYLTEDYGISWQRVYESFHVYSLMVYNDTLFLGTGGNGLWKGPPEGHPLSVNDLEAKILYSLIQNYPNPFNSTTIIKIVIPKSSFVNLKVYDLLGREVATLVNEEKPAGSYEVDFNGNGLSSGIYFYKLQTESYSEVKKMILLK